MFTKIIELDDYFPKTGEPTLRVVARSERGRWYAERPGAGEKTASEAFDYIKAVTPREGCTIVLVNALGTYEYYDDNRNGDAFPERPYRIGERATCGHPGCQPRGLEGWISPDEVVTRHYKTFETRGGIYKHHCFPAGTRVLMANRERVAIEDVKVGDVVETHAGPHPVTALFHKPYTGAGVRLRLRGQTEALTGTSDHPVWVLRREQVHCRHGYSRLTESQHPKNCREMREPLLAPEWAPLSSVQPGDYLLLRPPSHGSTTVNPAFASLVGWVASEGYLGARGLIQFTFSAKNNADIHAVKACFAELGVHVTETPRPKLGTVMLSACSATLHHELGKYVRGTLGDKTLTRNVLTWDRASLLRLLGAYIDGDGHVASSGVNHGQLRIRSSSPSMLSMLADVVRSLSIPVTTNWDKAAGEMISPTNGQTYASNGSGCVAVVPDYVETLVQYSRKRSVRKTEGATRGFAHEGYHLVQVTERDDVELDEDVYNLEVEGPHSFVAGEVIVHNCNKDPRKSLGRIEKAFWNTAMHRVELLLEIRNRLDPELVERINSGEFPACSMGCNVRWDVCAKCGHRAPTRKDYCEHLRAAMRQIDPASGVRNCALNPSPSFFDISFVWRPADRTGFLLKKVAEDGAYMIRTGASLGEKVADYAAKRAAVNKVSDIQKELAGEIEAVRTAPDIQAIRRYRQAVPPKAPMSATETQIDAMSELPFDALLSTLAAKNASLTTGEFARVFLRKTAGVMPSALLLDRMVALQPSVLSVLGRYPKLAEELGSYVTVNPARRCPNAEAKLASMGDWLNQRVNQAVDPPVGPGYLTSAQEPPRTDLLSMTDPNTGHLYTTTRGAAMRANHEDMKGLVGTTLGLSALYGLGLYGLANVSPAASAIGGLGLGVATAPSLLRSARPYRNPAYLTDQGVRVSGGTEFKLASAFAKFAADYAERLPSHCHVGNMVDEVRRRARVPDIADDHFERWEKQADDATEPPTLSLDDFSSALGALLLS